MRRGVSRADAQFVLVPVVFFAEQFGQQIAHSNRAKRRIKWDEWSMENEGQRCEDLLNCLSFAPLAFRRTSGLEHLPQACKSFGQG